MPSKTAVEEIEGRLELIGKKIAEARHEASENRKWAQEQDEAADALTKLRDEYVGLLEDAGAR